MLYSVVFFVLCRTRFRMIFDTCHFDMICDAMHHKSCQSDKCQISFQIEFYKLQKTTLLTGLSTDYELSYFFAYGFRGDLAYSTDAKTWTIVSEGLSNDVYE